MIQYQLPQKWLQYDFQIIAQNLIDAKAAIISLKNMPYQKDWVERLQLMELKREVAGTSRIEGADFTDNELEAAMQETPDELFTRSQRQAHTATKTYRWLTEIPEDRPIDAELIKEIHRLMITGADDDHCEPGVTRKLDHNVRFGVPSRRGAIGGADCDLAFENLSKAIATEFRDHDPIIQAVAAHYHLAAMHPFLDGNGRTARALEALFLQRAGLKDISFVSVSNYYYDEKRDYLKALTASGDTDHDLTAILNFCLKGIALSVSRVMRTIQTEVAKAVYRNTMYDLFGRLDSKRRKVVNERQLAILKLLLKYKEYPFLSLIDNSKSLYSNLKNPTRALVRDVIELVMIGALTEDSLGKEYLLKINLEWPQWISESDFLKKIKSEGKRHALPAKYYLPKK